jgi:uncharacterized membrane protein YfcA
MLLSLLVGSIPGILLTSRLAPALDERIIRWLLAAVLLVVSFKLLTS